MYSTLPDSLPPLPRYKSLAVRDYLLATPSTKKYPVNGILLSGYRTKKTAAMAHLRML